ncbi:MAG TPA: hypothetical protein VN811_09930 [Thermoanaerobaculia bacterium]|nr:hypothetical protein [Thermoanaerobaculia bacterium]
MATRGLSAILLVVGVLPFIPRPATADFLPLTGPQLVAASEHIVVAVVDAANSRWSGKLIVTDYALRIEDRLAGEATGPITLSLPGGTVGDETHRTSLAVPLEVGERYLLFLDDPAGRGPSATTITGGWQGAVRESAGFTELVEEVRAFLAGERRDLAVITTAAAAGLKSVAPGFQVRDPAVPPIVFNPLPDSSPFAPYDQEQMAYWNVYQPDLFRAAPSTGTWSWGNGVFDVAGFPDDSRLQAEFGRPWPPGAYSMTVSRIQDGHTVEADIALNPAYPWTLDEAEATRPGFPLSFRHHILEILGRIWGLEPSIFALEVPRGESAVGITPQAYRLATLFSIDAEAVRATFGDAPLVDGLISAYGVQPAPLYPVFLPSRPIPSSVRRGGKVSLSTPIKIENTGTEELVDPEVEIYLVPQRFSLDGAVLLKRFRVRASIPRGVLHHVVPGTIKVPRTVPPGVYYLAFRLRLAGDEYAGNDVAWSPYDVSLTVKAK